MEPHSQFSPGGDKISYEPAGTTVGGLSGTRQARLDYRVDWDDRFESRVVVADIEGRDGAARRGPTSRRRRARCRTCPSVRSRTALRPTWIAVVADRSLAEAIDVVGVEQAARIADPQPLDI